MSKIKILSSDVANKIAAGEVVERPASVVKELLENAIDAESTSIRVEIRAGGKALIRVSDNGTGMEREDALLAIERHATSKVSQIEDLDNIQTFGFRGEALASIASVSEFELLTRTPEAIHGTQIKVDGGVFRSVEESGCSPGTHISISNLFNNVPARLKFLKTDTTEINHITNHVTWAALAHPKIHFSLTHNTKTILDVRACDSYLERTRLLYGKDFADNLIEFNEELPEFKLTGLLGKPDFNKSNREYQLFFMNKRPIRSQMLGAALKEGVSATVQKDRQAVTFLFMTLEPDNVDVNVHPSKIEVRFRNERTIFSGIVKILRSVINKEKFIPKIETSIDTSENDTSKKIQTDHTPEIITTQQQSNPTPSIDHKIEPVDTSESIEHHTETPIHTSESIEDHTEKAEKVESKPKDSNTQPDKTDPINQVSGTTVVHPQQSIPEGVKLRLLDFDNVELKTNLFKTYIVAEGEDRIFFIDQHVAAERVLYERFVNQLKTDGIPVQGLLLPITLEVTPQQIGLLKVHGDIFKKIGFDLEDFGGNTILIRAIPATLPTRSAGQTVTDLLDKLPEQQHTDVEIPKAIDDALITLSCRSAVKAGDTLDTKEMINLVRELSKAKLPFNCPHARPIIIEMGRDELERRFHRS
ncbi:DNA mismatch repair endonuclease MutL [Candidatus Poribacteria bacterium]|nr:DNA mismatch repair endonuclease MutL [Candidatus Poribacteria bacterium]